MRILMTILFTLTISLLFGQDFKNHSAINDFFNNLNNSKVDTVLFYENETVGSDEPMVLVKNDSCFIYGNTQVSYVLWRKNTKDYISKLSTFDCYTYDTIQYDFESVWKQYFENKEKIKKETIFLPKYVKNGDTVTIALEHYSYSQLMFIIKNDTVEFEVSGFNLNKTIDGRFENLNYKINNESMRNSIRNLIEDKIEIIEKNNLIEKKTVYNKVYN